MTINQLIYKLQKAKEMVGGEVELNNSAWTNYDGEIQRHHQGNIFISVNETNEDVNIFIDYFGHESGDPIKDLKTQMQEKNVESGKKWI